MTTEAIRYLLFVQCEDGQHESCMGEFRSMPTIDGGRSPHTRCSCGCHHDWTKEDTK